MDLARKLKKDVKHDNSGSWSGWNGLQRLGKKNRRIGNPLNVKPNQITALFRLASILRRVMDT